MTLRIGLALPLVLVLGGTSAQAATGSTDWPCQQRYVPSLSPAALWSGPDIEPLGDAWERDADVAALANRIASARTSPDDAKTAVAGFADALGEGREQRLTLLFSGVFDLLNGERSRDMAAIRRFATQQTNVTANIAHLQDRIAGLPADTAAQARKDLEDELAWKRRLYEQRNRSLPALCDQPVDVEKRLGRLARAIQSVLK